MCTRVSRGMIVALIIMPTVVSSATTAGVHMPKDCTQDEKCVAFHTILLQTEYKHVSMHGAGIPSRKQTGNISFSRDAMLIAQVETNASSSDVSTVISHHEGKLLTEKERKKERKKETGEIAYSGPRRKDLRWLVGLTRLAALSSAKSELDGGTDLDLQPSLRKWASSERCTRGGSWEAHSALFDCPDAGTHTLHELLFVDETVKTNWTWNAKAMSWLPVVAQASDLTVIASSDMHSQSGPSVAEIQSELHVLHFAHVARNGVIANSLSCHAWWVHNRAPKNRSVAASTASPIVDTAITIADEYLAQIYHGPIDVLSSLANVHGTLLADRNTYLHVGSTTNYTSEWLDIVDIPLSRIVEGDIWAKTLYVPKRCIENPSLSQYIWLQSKVWTAIGVPDVSSRNLLIVTKRGKRGFSNHDTDVMPLASEYAAAHDLQVHVHDDTRLPSVRKQLEIFSRAVMVLGPHGAAETFTIAMAPGACLIEAFHPGQGYVNSVFQKMARVLRLHYIGFYAHAVPYQGNIDQWDVPNIAVDIAKLRSAMQLCGEQSA